MAFPLTYTFKKLPKKSRLRKALVHTSLSLHSQLYRLERKYAKKNVIFEDKKGMNSKEALEFLSEFIV